MGAPAVPPRRAGRPAVLRTLAPRLRAGDPRPHATKDRAVTATELAALIVAIASVTAVRSEEHTSELQSLMRSSYAVFCMEIKMRVKNDLRHRIYDRIEATLYRV